MKGFWGLGLRAGGSHLGRAARRWPADVTFSPCPRTQRKVSLLPVGSGLPGLHSAIIAPRRAVSKHQLWRG